MSFTTSYSCVPFLYADAFNNSCKWRWYTFCHFNISDQVCEGTFIICIINRQRHHTLSKVIIDQETQVILIRKICS